MKKRRTPIKIRRGIYILPNLFTTGNLFCGFWAIISVFQEKFFYAAVAILLACVFDILDGKVARLSGATSKFGVQYDSLADLVSFGIAPALLAFSWALREYGKFGWLAAFLFVVCGALRLARFNVQSSSGEVKYFKGLPIPAAASMIALTILLYLRLIETDWVKDIVILVMIYVLAFLMVSNIRYFSFKELGLAKRKPFSTFMFVVLSMIVIVMEPRIVLFGFVLAYVFSGPVGMLMAWQKKRALKRIEPVPAEEKVEIHE
ncbi:MAG: CDP-diacylglycerol--serine O-phosphatidyltransferase [Deltaproteobacteria bacterium CG_4_8_14_3_um_filter_45_9]|nr:MAG: CDP-diacylglycerol--serine O-phosphatidyltransferase [Deltaproteobacteria bacterium CG03_land_8_20_14_0_80_45_14]PIX25267.1 MAG: CDP-diacylglycerol--serine O-phosphatidyltransferase [Deltaproteobacteria bacterium CG_4_8_14_3_um_filter_45_9]